MVDTNKLNDPSRSPLRGHPQPGPERIHTELQIDPQLKEGPASSGRMIAYGVALIVVLGVVFYGLNNTAIAPQGTTATATATPPAPAETSPAPATNAAPGTTTGAAPSNTQGPKSAPTGTEIDRSKNGNNSAAK